ncbi:MAG: phosphoribosylformylglycinamidine cyclo-ligase [Planctomycetes bacterium]|nr:phosphoribosylformylglycinamidine cyclo-ligase [Planctomycetota bacterium]NOG55206.1 phosphoribosylformylglycinamidine cyclo-ligase [Planctomycetota bacterium]
MAARDQAPLTYAGSGVDIEAGDRMVGLIQTMMRSTHGPRVIDRPGGFAGLVRLDFNEQLFRRNYREPVLVACTDGVGSKVKLACQMRVYDTVGIDCVAMCINDLIVEGAEPLLFLDYLGVNRLDPTTAAQIVAGVTEGCRQARAALIGGETAELPDIYAQGDFDLAGFAVGVLELDRAVDSSRVEAGDVVIGLASNGLHSNGYSLVRQIVRERGLDLNRPYDALGTDQTLGQVLLTPTRIYSRPIVRLLRRYKVKRIISGMAHITGGGLPGNICRVLPPDVDAEIKTQAWTIPSVFRFLQDHGNVDTDEMFHVFNMGIGYTLIVRPSFASSVMKQLERLGETPYRLGEIVPGTGEVVLT